MAIGETKNTGLNRSAGSAPTVSAGSVKADWQLCHTDMTQDNSTALLDLANSGTHEASLKMVVPPGATRVQIRHAYSTDATTFTADPVVAIVGTDLNGIPQRLDTPTDSNATGLTLAGAATGVFTASSRLWGEVSAEYDLRGSEYVHILTDTAANYTDGSTAVDNVECYLRFLN